MWDCERRGSRWRELHSREVCCQSDGHLRSRQPIVVRDNSCASTPEALSASRIITANVVCLLESTPESSAHGHQVASH